MAGAELGDLRDLVSPSLTVHPVFLFGDLKLFEPKTMCPIIAVRNREGR